MSTKIYGASDDLIEFEGDFTGEVGCYGTDDDEVKPLVILNDGTILKCFYGKNDAAIWAIELVRRGSLFLRIDPCVDEDADPNSDVAHFADGIKWAYFAKDWEAVR
jgi:hypothetical protein